MNNLTSIATLAGEFESAAELKAYCDAQYKSLEQAAKRIADLEAHIKHLEGLLGGAVPLLEVAEPEILKVSPEQAICEMGIERLQKTAMTRDLTIDETKRLDILVKNLLLLRGQATQINENRNQFDGLSTEQLVAIVKDE